MRPAPRGFCPRLLIGARSRVYLPVDHGGALIGVARYLRVFVSVHTATALAPVLQPSTSTLVVAAHSLVEKYRDCVYYLPSFETVMYGVRNPWQSDMRHVSNEAVRRVMKLFQIMFMEDQSNMPLPKFAEAPPASFRDRFRRWI